MIKGSFIIILLAAISWYVYNEKYVLIHKVAEYGMPRLETHLFGRINDTQVNHEQCKVVHPEVGSCEDLIIDDTSGLIYLPCGDPVLKGSFFPGCGNFDFEGRNGKIRDSLYLYNPQNEEMNSLEVRGYDGKALILHGIDLLVDEEDNTKRTIFIVNHHSTHSVISAFSHKLGETHVDHLYDAESPLIYTPNSVTAISPTAFYVTNDHTFREPPLRNVAELLGSRNVFTDVTYCQYNLEEGSTTCEKKVPGFAYANGIARFENGAKIAVTDSMGSNVTIFSRDVETNDLTKLSSTPMGCVLDNIRVDSNGDLIVACFPNPGKLFARLGDIGNSTKRVDLASLKLTPGNEVPEVLVHEKGELFSIMTGTTFDPNSKTVYGASLGENGLLICQL